MSKLPIFTTVRNLHDKLDQLIAQGAGDVPVLLRFDHQEHNLSPVCAVGIFDLLDDNGAYQPICTLQDFYPKPEELKDMRFRPVRNCINYSREEDSNG